jgi:phosphomevalonate kinase
MILIGEYAVLEGADALVAAVDRRSVVTFGTQPDANTILLSSPQMHIIDLPCIRTRQGHIRFDPALEAQTRHKMNFIALLLKAALDELQVPLEKPCGGWMASFNTDAFYVPGQPVKLGFGSSASLTVALIAGLGKLFKKDLPANDLFNISLRVHHAAQGRSGSGIDVAACSHGGVLQYNFARSEKEITGRIKSIKMPDDLEIAVVYTGHSASTRDMVSGFYELKELQPDLFNSTLSAMINCSGRAVGFFGANQTDQFMNEVDSFYQLAEQLSRNSALPVISPAHQAIYAIARKHSCFYKPSGAGGGDIGTIFYRKGQEVRPLFKELTSLNFPPLPAAIAESGVICHF